MDTKTALSKIIPYGSVSRWDFSAPKQPTEVLYGIAASIANPAAEARFVLAAWEATRAGGADILPIPPSGELQPPISWRVLRTPAARPFVVLCWKFYPEFVLPGELKTFGVSKRASQSPAVRWTVNDRGDTLLIGLTTVDQTGKELYRLDPMPAGDAVTVLGAVDLFAAVDSMLF